jgi:hypothetical protein
MIPQTNSGADITDINSGKGSQMDSQMNSGMDTESNSGMDSM